MKLTLLISITATEVAAIMAAHKKNIATGNIVNKFVNNIKYTAFDAGLYNVNKKYVWDKHGTYIRTALFLNTNGGELRVSVVTKDGFTEIVAEESANLVATYADAIMAVVPLITMYGTKLDTIGERIAERIAELEDKG